MSGEKKFLSFSLLLASIFATEMVFGAELKAGDFTGYDVVSSKECKLTVSDQSGFWLKTSYNQEEQLAVKTATGEHGESTFTASIKDSTVTFTVNTDPQGYPINLIAKDAANLIGQCEFSE